jgi:hypothetical protein
MIPEKCPNCDGSNLFRHVNVRVNGGVGPRLLPNLGAAIAEAVVCHDCGLLRFFVSQGDRLMMPARKQWERLGPPHAGQARDQRRPVVSTLLKSALVWSGLVAMLVSIYWFTATP